jgi:hypothetical protein
LNHDCFPEARSSHRAADRRKETPVQLPVLVVVTQLARRDVHKMRRVANYQIPPLRCWDRFEIVGVIERNPLRQSVLSHRTPACLNCLRIDVGETQRAAKAITKKAKADKSGAGAPLKHAPLARHAKIMKQPPPSGYL